MEIEITLTGEKSVIGEKGDQNYGTSEEMLTQRLIRCVIFAYNNSSLVAKYLLNKTVIVMCRPVFYLCFLSQSLEKISSALRIQFQENLSYVCQSIPSNSECDIFSTLLLSLTCLHQPPPATFI